MDYVSSFSRSNSDSNVHVLRLSDRSFMDRFACHAACMPGMLNVWNKILVQGPKETCCGLKIREMPAMFVVSTCSSACCRPWLRLPLVVYGHWLRMATGCVCLRFCMPLLVYGHW